MRKFKWLRLFLVGVLPFIALESLCAQTKKNFEAAGDQYFETSETFFPGTLDSMIFYVQLAIDSYEKADVGIKILKCRNALHVAYYYLGNYMESQKQILIAIDELDKYYERGGIAVGATLSNYALFLREKGDYRQAIKYLEQSLNINETLEKDTLSTISISNIGDTYSLIGDYDEALKYFHKVLNLSKQGEFSMFALRYVNIYRKIGRAYFQKEELDSAKTYFKRTLSFFPDQGLISGDIWYMHKVGVDLEIAEVFLAENQRDSVNHYIDKVIHLSKIKNYNDEGAAYEILGKLYLQEQAYEKAIHYFYKSKEATVEKFSTYERHYKIAKRDISLANAYLQSGDFSKALAHFQLAIQMLSQDNITDDFYELPSLQNIYSRAVFLDALVGKGDAFVGLYHQKKNEKDLKAAYVHFQFAAQVIQDIRQDYQQESAQLRLSREILPIYEKAIEVSLLLNQLTGKEEYLHQAFVFCESNKAILLLEATTESLAKGFGGIPDSLLEKEREIKIELAFYKRKLSEEKNKGKAGEKALIEVFENHIFDFDQKYKTLISSFESEYPKYHQLKYGTRLASVKEVQEKIKSTSSRLVEYFFGEKNIYVFSITSDSIFVNSLKKEVELIDTIQQLRELLSVRPKRNSTQDFENYVKYARGVFQKILAPSISENDNHLIIIADDYLGYLPFEALLTKPCESNKVSYSLGNLSYLMEAYEISYSYSATLFLQNSLKISNDADEVFLGIAPSFNDPQQIVQRFCQGGGLYSLFCNEKEVEKINTLFEGETLLGEAATKSSFESQAKHYQILHLATHACIDPQNSQFNKIYFNDDYLSNNDLYSLQLNSELAVLSACDTGSGQLAKGEGVMSLARGFIHAGCPSVVMSLWSVDDCTTSDIMSGFYENLYHGKTKSQSIRQAKMNYVASADMAQQHPYYWAAFVQIGNFEPLSPLKKNRLVYGLAIFAALLLFCFFLFWKMRIGR